MTSDTRTQIAIALRKPFEELTQEEIKLLWEYTSNKSMKELLEEFKE